MCFYLDAIHLPNGQLCSVHCGQKRSWRGQQLIEPAEWLIWQQLQPFSNLPIYISRLECCSMVSVMWWLPFACRTNLFPFLFSLSDSFSLRLVSGRAWGKAELHLYPTTYFCPLFIFYLSLPFTYPLPNRQWMLTNASHPIAILIYVCVCSSTTLSFFDCLNIIIISHSTGWLSFLFHTWLCLFCFFHLCWISHYFVAILMTGSYGWCFCLSTKLWRRICLCPLWCRLTMLPNESVMLLSAR